MLRCVVLLMLVSLTGCRCRPGPVEPVELGLRTEPRELDFGRVLEGSQKTLPLTLVAVTRASIEVELATQSPFSVAPLASVPGGDAVDVAVTFAAGSEAVERVLTLTVGELTAEVKLRGVGVRPPVCTPSAECIISTYSLEEDRCIETQSPDDAPCDPSSICLEQGRCRSGQCLGIARRCDDGDLCTDDACSMEIGCVNTPRACPNPTAACTVATCDSRTGCGEGPAADLTPCGPLDCVSVNFCVSGMCRTEPTPDGLPCSPAIACLPEATCQNQVCSRVNEADWNPDWSARLPGAPVGALSSQSSNLFLSLCMEDAGLPLDAGVVDAGADDAGLDDAGVDDAGVLDAGAALVCALTSYTGTGFERFTYVYEDGAPREVRAVSIAGVLLSTDAGLELRSPISGVLRHSLPVQVGETRWALSSEGVFLAIDGGLQSWVDGGLQWLAAVDDDAAVVRGDALFAWSADAGLLTRVELLGDGGVARRDVVVTGAPGDLLLTADGVAIFPASGRVRFEADGGASAVSYDFSDAGALREQHTLASAGTMSVFFERCDAGCETWVRNVDVESGATRFEGRVLRDDVEARIVASTLVEPRAGTFAALIREERDGGPRAFLQLFIDGESKALCRLPEASGAVEQARFSSSALVITAARSDGGVVLESYGLGAVPLSTFGWTTSGGVGGTRSDRP